MKLLNFKDALKLNLEDVKKYYKDFVNPNQTSILSQFPFNKELFVYAEGMYIFTETNKKILDFTGGIGVLGLGHNNKKIIETRLNFQKEKLIEIHKIYFSKYLAALSYNLATLMPGDLNKTFLCNSGAEAVEGALKISYKYYKGTKKNIIYSDRSYHGKLIGSGSISGSYKQNLFPRLQNTQSFVFNDISNLEKILEDNSKNGETCCVVLETYSASTLEDLSDSFVNKLKELKKKYNFLIIADEVFMGFYKSKNIFHFLKYKDFIPDIVTISKSFGGGKSSISAYVCKDTYYKSVYGNLSDAFLHTTTYNGFGEECATAVEATSIFGSEEYKEKAKFISDYTLKKMQDLVNKNSKIVSHVKGTGILNGIFFDSNISKITEVLDLTNINFIKDRSSFAKKLYALAVSFELFEKYNILTYINETGKSNHLVLGIPLIAEKDQIDYFFISLNKILSKGLNFKMLKIVLNFLKS